MVNMCTFIRQLSFEGLPVTVSGTEAKTEQEEVPTLI